MRSWSALPRRLRRLIEALTLLLVVLLAFSVGILFGHGPDGTAATPPAGLDAASPTTGPSGGLAQAPSGSPSPSDGASASASASASATATTGAASATPQPSGKPAATAGTTPRPSPSPTPRPTPAPTPRPTATPRPTPTPTPTSAPPAAPTGLTGAKAGNHVNLTWNASAGAVSYEIWRGTSGGSLTLLKKGVTLVHYLDSAVTAGTTYDYVVFAVGPTGLRSTGSIVVKVTA